MNTLAPLPTLIFSACIILLMAMIALWPYLVPPSDIDYEEEEAKGKAKQDNADYGPFR